MSRMIIIGDIHGCYEELNDLLEHIGVTESDTLVSVGDIVDRGPNSEACVQQFRERPNSIVLCGNHERKHIRETLSYSQEIVRHQFAERYSEAVGWMSTLPYWLETDDVRVVHAATIPGQPLALVPEDILSGTTSGSERLMKLTGGVYWPELYQDEKPIVFGHHVVGSEPLILNDRVFGIDTGCCHGQRLTALTVPDFRIWSVPARANHWKTEARRWEIPILRQRPWARMNFDQIDAKIRELEKRHPAASSWLTELEAWATGHRMIIPALHEEAQRLLEHLMIQHGEPNIAATIQLHPAVSTLFRLWKGKLQTTHMGCNTPFEVQQLASQLSVLLPIDSDPPTTKV